jgi:hypothetical protein
MPDLHKHASHSQTPPAPVHSAAGEDEPPPFCGTWPRLYAAIVIYLSTVITIFYLFTRAYRFPQ